MLNRRMLNRPMLHRSCLQSLLLVSVSLLAIFPVSAQDGPAPKQNEAVFRVEVDMVLLNVAVTDSKGNYILDLKPWDFQITEDGVGQKMATFGEGNEAPRAIVDFGAATVNKQVQVAKPSRGLIPNRASQGAPSAVFAETTAERISSLVAGASVFILFDTSNYMYEGFVYAQDAIAEFVRSLDSPDRVALYSYSRDFMRAAPLTADRGVVLRGLRSTVAGDDAALYNAMLLTLKDAATLSGRKVVVVFSNGPDNASMVAPEDVREFAQAEGISIYMVSTREAHHDPVSTAVFQRMSASTGGKAYFAKNWKDQEDAFTLIRDDLAHLYSLSYYPATNPNHGWRSITVKLAGDHLKKYQVRTRTGYRPRPPRVAEGE
jgi:Ca-activated chloride channel family protein